jgi:D-sedoheptulose 7-phosphate isomerase
MNIVRALDYARGQGMQIFAVIGREAGHAARIAEGDDTVLVVPTVDPSLITPHTEAFQAVVWHCLVSHPALQVKATKW